MLAGCLFPILEGAHLNPAFSLTMCLLGRLPWAKLPVYSLVQTLSAFCASGATYALYYGNCGDGFWGVCVRAGVPGMVLNEKDGNPGRSPPLQMPCRTIRVGT